jgi:hypothetical protein
VREASEAREREARQGSQREEDNKDEYQGEDDEQGGYEQFDDAEMYQPRCMDCRRERCCGECICCHQEEDGDHESFGSLLQ